MIKSRSQNGRRAAMIGVVSMLAVLTAATACDLPTGPPRAGAPEEFRFSLWSFSPLSRYVELRGDTLLVVHVHSRPDYSGSDTTRVVPQPDDWRAFWSAAYGSGVRHWLPAYERPVADGETWSMTIRRRGLDGDWRGNNAYPDSRGGRHFNRTTAFNNLVDAVTELTGGAF